jgi:cytochrome oxidase Cu insertion factor (SCO1/SenC/PrrC family)
VKHAENAKPADAAIREETSIMRTTLLTAGLLIGMALAVTPARADLAVGDDAPDFSLEGSDGNTYTLADFKGKQAVVVAWYPKAFTGG